MKISNLFALFFVAAMLLGVTRMAHADTTCAGTLMGSIEGNVTVPVGATCVLKTNVVTGNVVVSQGARLTVDAYQEPANILGSVVAQQCNSALLQGDVTVGGNVIIQGCTENSKNGFQGPGILISGNFVCNSNFGPCEAWLGDVAGNVQIDGDGSTTPSDVSLTSIKGTLQCQQNRVQPTHIFGPDWVNDSPQDQCGAEYGFVAHGSSIMATGSSPGPVMACSDLSNISAAAFPVPNMVITSAVDVPATSTLPEHCKVEGLVNEHVSPVDGCSYGDGFEVRLPLPANWNHRFMYQGGGGTQGTITAATGVAGTLTPTLAKGYVVAADDSGHENVQLAQCGTRNINQFYLDPMSTLDSSGQAIQVTTLAAKYLAAALYGTGPTYSYWVGCSAGGRQGMTMSQVFPQYFDGIIAGDPVYDAVAVNLSEIYGMQKIVSTYRETTPRLPTLTEVPGPAPDAAQPIPYAAFPQSDQALLETALLQACDALDGVTDGVIDNMPACQTHFDPATATYANRAGVRLPLQCPGTKNSTCLSRDQIAAVESIHQGPRDARGQPVAVIAGTRVSDPVDDKALGYPYDAGFMSIAGIPSRKIGTSSTPPGDYSAGVTQFPYMGIQPPDPSYDVMNFDFTTDQSLLALSSPQITNSVSLDIREFVDRGGKIIYYHGASDPGPPVAGTIEYYTAMSNQQGGLEQARRFSRLYLIPGMCHCSGGPSTDQFDMLTPMTQWVEQGVAPETIVASGSNFTSAVYGIDVQGPTTRSRPLCAYPQQARYVGGSSGLPASLALVSNYRCVNPAVDRM